MTLLPFVKSRHAIQSEVDVGLMADAGGVAVTASGVEQPRRSCPQRPPHAGRRASADDRIRLQPAGRPATALATKRAPGSPKIGVD
jgi:hypothetical protein